MEAKNNIVEDYTPVLEQNFGKVGSAEWENPSRRQKPSTQARLLKKPAEKRK